MRGFSSNTKQSVNSIDTPSSDDGGGDLERKLSDNGFQGGRVQPSCSSLSSNSDTSGDGAPPVALSGPVDPDRYHGNNPSPISQRAAPPR